MFDALLKEDFDDAIAVERLRLDVLDVADLRGQVAFVEVDDAAGHVVGQQPVIGPDDADHRNIDVGKDVGRRAQRRQRAENRNEKGEDDEGIRPPQRDLNDPHVSISCRNKCLVTGNGPGSTPSGKLYEWLAAPDHSLAVQPLGLT